MPRDELVVREGLDQPRPLAQIKGLLADGQLQQTLPLPGPVTLISGNWPIAVPELRTIQQLLADRGLALQLLVSDEPRTRIAAAALAIAWQPSDPRPADGAGDKPDQAGIPLHLHHGTLRSGDHLEVEGSLLVLGDVNPGARVVAAGHVLVWGTLRGVAHAGSRGDQSARITALQLRPVQLRIADAVARGPEDLPVPGVAEQAEIVGGLIAINPASPAWPAAGVSG